jgi:hypothetical protein
LRHKRGKSRDYRQTQLFREVYKFGGNVIVLPSHTPTLFKLFFNLYRRIREQEEDQNSAQNKTSTHQPRFDLVMPEDLKSVYDRVTKLKVRK